MPRNSVMIRTAMQRQNAADTRMRRPVGQCASNTTKGSRPGVCRFRRTGHARLMGIGTSIFLIAAGAILYFAVNADVSGSRSRPSA